MNRFTSQPDILLLFPKTGADLGSTVATPHSLLSISAPLLKAGYSVRIVDQRVEPAWKKIITDILARDVICVGISTMSGTQIFHALELAELVRRLTNGRVPIVWGGTHPTLLPEQTLMDDRVDAICVGEGEETFLEMVQCLAAGRSLRGVPGAGYKDGGLPVINPPRPLLDVETLLPTPWELIDPEAYIHRDFYIKGVNRSLDIGQTSRGCPCQCGFCCSATIRQRKWRPMSAEKSLDMIVESVKRFKLDAIWLRDDEFYINRKRSHTIAEGILSNKLNIRWYTSGTRVDVFNRASADELITMKRSGADTLKFGAESGSNRVLKLMGKGIRAEETIEANLKAKKFGIIPAYALMIGFPTETFEEIHQTIDLFNRLRRDNDQAQFEVFASFTAFPGTPLFPLAVENGLVPPDTLEGWSNWLMDDYDFDGRKLPWFNAKDRMKIGNLTFMSLLANAAPNAVQGIRNPLIRTAAELALGPLSRFERFRLSRKLYTFAPELRFINAIRRRIFYDSHAMVH